MVAKFTVNKMSHQGSRKTLWLMLARFISWLTVPIYILGMGLNLWLQHRLNIDISILDILLAIGFGVFAVIGALLVRRHPENWIGWIMVAIGLMTALFPAAESYSAFATMNGKPVDFIVFYGVWANDLYWTPLLALAFVYFPLLFPTGRLLSPSWRLVAIYTAVNLACITFFEAVRPVLNGQNIQYQIDNPIAMPALSNVYTQWLSNVLFLGMILAGLSATISVYIRYRRSNLVERQQLKWFLFAAALVPISIIVGYLPMVTKFFDDVLFGSSLIALPAAVGLAILRYRLYEIDIIIRRTLQYAIITGLLVLVYLGSVILLQGLFTIVTGQESALSIVISTLIIAALFNPLRRRVQMVIDRRFYRRKYNAQQVLDRFALTVRDEMELEMLISELIIVVQETMQPENISIWVKR